VHRQHRRDPQRDRSTARRHRRERRDAHPLVVAAAVSYAANCALGTAVATGRLRTGRAHWVHHALYICTSTLAAGAASSLLWSRSRAGWALLPAAVPLVAIPTVSARTRGHIGIALSAAPFFAAALLTSAREAREHREHREAREHRDRSR
jgi:hypothetical protein